MVRPLWQLLLIDPSCLTCDECFAVMEYYAELLASGSTDLLPKIREHLQRCPDCKFRYEDELRRLVPTQSEMGTAARSDPSRRLDL